ncbi:hypothetical protein [Bacillus pumilus]|uniref:hypothetical protein n=1 Tax=Bacillus pumilus TaxID=1408 RepID=UPI0016433604|nr:hypothetical protein [Bacillus pumilus]
MFDEEFKRNEIWKDFDGVKEEGVYDLEERLLGSRGNLKGGEGLDEVTGMVYG